MIHLTLLKIRIFAVKGLHQIYPACKHKKEALKVFVNTNNLITITEANQNFSKVARMVDENGSVVILKNNVPLYLIVEFSLAQQIQEYDDEDIIGISKRLIAQNREAYKILAQ